MLHKSLSCSSLFEGAMSSNGRLVGSPSRRNAEQFPEARLVRITRGGVAIGVNPVGMLDPQIVVKLFLELGVGVDLVRDCDWLGESNEFHKRFFFGGCLLQITAERGTMLTRLFDQPPRFG